MDHSATDPSPSVAHRSHVSINGIDAEQLTHEAAAVVLPDGTVLEQERRGVVRTADGHFVSAREIGHLRWCWVCQFRATLARDRGLLTPEQCATAGLLKEVAFVDREGRPLCPADSRLIESHGDQLIIGTDSLAQIESERGRHRLRRWLTRLLVRY
ncbi:MAG: hypothetical protein AAFZ67_11355 [Planctomycetota bacterium]